MDETRDGMEGVEEKMRVQLHAQSLEAGFGELAFEVGGAQFAFVIAMVVMLPVMGQEDQPVNDDVKGAVPKNGLADNRAELKGRALNRALTVKQRRMDRDLKQRQRNRRPEMQHKP